MWKETNFIQHRIFFTYLALKLDLYLVIIGIVEYLNPHFYLYLAGCDPVRSPWYG